jgi:hypothetical protein
MVHWTINKKFKYLQEVHGLRRSMGQFFLQWFQSVWFRYTHALEERVARKDLHVTRYQIPWETKEIRVKGII